MFSSIAMHKNPEACIFYVVTDGYLFPSLLSAMQARQNTSPALADVLILCIGEPTQTNARVTEIAARYGIKVLVRPASAIKNMPINYGRLFVNELLPDHYSRIVYIDGDTQVTGSLDALFHAPLDAGRFYASRDPNVLFSLKSKRWLRENLAYRQALGLYGDYRRYFNSGVLVINREGWDDVVKSCIAIYEKLGERFIHKDQDCLNIAAADRVVLISHRWNFPGFLIGTPAEAACQPRIYHFMSNPRPWLAAVKPWGRPWRDKYLQMLQANPELEILRPSFSRLMHLRYALQQQFKMLTEYGPVGSLKAQFEDLSL